MSSKIKITYCLTEVTIQICTRNDYLKKNSLVPFYDKNFHV